MKTGIAFSSGDGDAGVAFEFEDFCDGGFEIGEEEIAMDFAGPGRFEKKRGGAGDAGGFGVLPFVADDEGMIEIKVPFEARLDEETGLGFAAGTAIIFVVRTNENVV